MSETIELSVEGMSCEGCVSSVENALSRLTGVIEATAQLDANRAIVTIDPAQVDRRALEDAVEDAGFDVV